VEAPDQSGRRKDKIMDQEYQSARRRLPEPSADDRTRYESGDRYALAWRDSGVRRTRRASNWTAAALIAGVAATSGYFVHAAAPAPAGSAGGATSATTGAVHSTAGHGQKPSVTHSVVTSSGSGVTVGSSSSSGTGGGSTTTWRDN
jgi:hypothetical protein